MLSYGVRYKHGNRETDFITYVNAVEKDGAAYSAGLREGDVILSINGQNMARVEHKSLVSYIRKCPMHLKMVVVSDERARKVELHMRYVHLQKKLQDKMLELEELQRQERDILSGDSDLLRRSSSPSPLGGPCIAAAAKVCCFCPPSKAEKLEAKEKSKSMGSAVSDRLLRSKENILYYDCYRKSQSSRELHKEQGSSYGKLSSPTQKASSGGDIITMTSAKSHSGSSNSMTKVNNNPTTQQQPPPLPPQHRPNFYQPGGGGLIPTNSSGNAPNYTLSSPLPQQHNNSSSTTGSTSGYVSDNNAQKHGSSSKPKSWDNMIGTKSFGGFGFGYGYGYFPQRPTGAEESHNHFTHPHHHNHHTHCSNHVHNHYYKLKSQNPGGMPSGPPGAPPTQGNISYRGNDAASACNATHHRYHAYPTKGQGGRSSHFTSPIPPPPSLGDNMGTNSRTLPLLKSSASRTSESSSGISPKMEKTLSDSSLNSEHHKDFPKAMSYFRASENEDNTHYSSEDEYDQYGTESSYEGKRIFV
ncbi:General receptor for phosphoinositides 1-associated scaffold protein [Orchesella cincta]|uniref:General receptor for phosphoinositides 1-associated scaffold protein n=1 Tax=Orchesella cincta TaxID=48709 RepID=A0A1D2MHA3_ORCCI|nr:General receptor for phosphoinositides 1-associated scaffold protein [Orchesella cincta]